MIHLSVRIYVLLFVVTTSTIIYAVYQQVLYVKKQRRDFIRNYRSPDIENHEDKVIKLFYNKQMYIRNTYKIKTHIKWVNTKQIVYNAYLGPITEKSYVVVIQCHSNVFFLRQLLESLKKAFFINTSLLIFSHDHYSYEMNKLISTINFARYIQIFYPYSLQLHPNVFPGGEPKACVDGLSCKKSKFRNPEAAQSKHHWWWQANQIFDHLNILENYNSSVLFLEENNYVTEDVFVVFKLLQYAKDIHCPFCEIISLTAHDPNFSQYTRKKCNVCIEVWTGNMPKAGIAFDRKIWNAIKTSKEEFCYFNDSNWDNSLRNVGKKKWKGSIYMTAIDGPRIFRFEKCDSKHVGCKLQYKVEQVKLFVKLISRFMYPYSIRIKVKSGQDFNSTATGYWNDARDHDLCMHFAKENVWF